MDTAEPRVDQRSGRASASSSGARSPPLRQVAHHRGTVIAAIFAAKLKTTFQLIWVGAAYFWFFVATAARIDVHNTADWGIVANFAGIVGVVSMVVSVALTIYSMAIYLYRYGRLLRADAGPVR